MDLTAHVTLTIQQATFFSQLSLKFLSFPILEGRERIKIDSEIEREREGESERERERERERGREREREREK